MAFIKMTLSKLKLDKGNFTKTLDSEIKRQMRQAARAFFKAAVQSVPVRTGFARGAFTSIVEAIGDKAAAGNITPAESYLRGIKKIRTVPFKEYYYFGKRKVLKTPEAGQQFATKPESIFKVVNNVYSFNFAISISYFNINDAFANPKTLSAPWKSFEKGTFAFRNYLTKEGILKLPKVSNYIIKETYKVE